MIDPNDKEVVNALILRNDVKDMLLLSISAALNCTDLDWAEHICIELSMHEDNQVRGNAILSFGHLARIFGVLNDPRIKNIVKQGLCSDDKYVHSQAITAAYDLSDFLGWDLSEGNGSDTP
jgi:hypothetical protein